MAAYMRRYFDKGLLLEGRTVEFRNRVRSEAPNEWTGKTMITEVMGFDPPYFSKIAVDYEVSEVDC